MSKSSLLPASCFCLPKVMGADSDLTPAVQVVVNGTPFHEFKHRIPLQMVTHLHVDGDLMLQSINFIGGQPPSNQVCGVSLSCLLVSFLNSCPCLLISWALSLCQTHCWVIPWTQRQPRQSTGKMALLPDGGGHRWSVYDQSRDQYMVTT